MKKIGQFLLRFALVKDFWYKILLLGIFIGILLSRTYFLGSSLWHDDAFNFVDKALTFAVIGQYVNAHSTGYPFWVMILGVVLFITHLISHQWSLIFVSNMVSAIAGALIFWPIYFLLKSSLKHRWLALNGSLFIMINPIIWSWSEIAMSDIMSLFLALLFIYFYRKFIDDNRYIFLALGLLCMYLLLMCRLQYVLLFIPIFIYRLYSTRNSVKSALIDIFLGFATIILVVVSYAVLNNFNLSILNNGFGYSYPGFNDLIPTLNILVKTAHLLMVVPAIIGMVYLYRKSKKDFYFFLYLFIIFWLYLSGWYKNGFFDIERYGLIFTVMILIVGAYCLIVSRFTRIVWAVCASIVVVNFISGVDIKMTSFKTYNTASNPFQDYVLKAGQIKLQKQIDYDYLVYDQLSKIISDNDVVFYWSNDWSMPKLLLAGAHLDHRPQLISINSKEQIMENFKIFRNKRIYLLRGVVDTYRTISDPKPEIKIQILANGQALTYYVDN